MEKKKKRKSHPSNKGNKDIPHKKRVNNEQHKNKKIGLNPMGQSSNAISQANANMEGKEKGLKILKLVLDPTKHSVVILQKENHSNEI